MTSGQAGGESQPFVTRHSLSDDRRKPQVLLAKDNPVNRILAVRLLEKQGHIVAAASDGNAVWVEWDKGESDIILMDIQMPEVNGFEATAASRQREKSTGRHIPIVALTAHAMKDDRERCFSAGLEACISKPIRANEPYATIEGLLEARVKALDEKGV